MFKDNTISARVMSVIKDKISATQGVFDEGVLKLEEELEDKKTKLADDLVKGLLDKIL